MAVLYLTGRFQDAREVVSAITRLKGLEFTAEDIALFSTEPVVLPAGVLDRRSRMSLVAVSGAIVSGVAATAFIYYTQYNYRLVTGGMPVFSFWASGVPSYELTMFGAVLATFGWFLWESGLLRREKAPAPKVIPDLISLRLRCPAERNGMAVSVLRSAGAADIHVLGENG